MSDPSSGCRELVSYQYFMLYYYFLDFILLLCLCVKSCFPIFLLQQQQNLPNLLLPNIWSTERIYFWYQPPAINN